MTSVVVPVYNGAHVLPDCLPATLALRGVDEWVWVDDGSTDVTANLLENLLESEPRARVVRHGANRGRAAARNTGIAHTAGDTLVFLDADVAPEPDTAERFVATLSEGATATVARLSLVEPLAADPYGEYLRRARRGIPPDARPGDVLPWRLFVTAACAVTREALDGAGGFDEQVAYGEDLALGCRLAGAAPHGLHASGSTACITDTSTFDQALANLAVFGAVLPDLEARCPDILRVAGLDHALQPGIRHAVASSTVLASVVGLLASVVPASVQPLAVRYLLGHTLVRAYDDARLHPRTGR